MINLVTDNNYINIDENSLKNKNRFYKKKNYGWNRNRQFVEIAF